MFSIFDHMCMEMNSIEIRILVKWHLLHCHITPLVLTCEVLQHVGSFWHAIFSDESEKCVFHQRFEFLE